MACSTTSPLWLRARASTLTRRSSTSSCSCRPQTAPIQIQDPWPTGGAAPLPPSALTYDPNLTSSYAQNWNFSLQQEISGELVLTAGYVGTRGVHLLGSRDINQPMPSPQQPNLRPLPFFSDINQIESSFDSVYHSLQLAAQCRFQEGLTGLFSYTWSRSIDNASNFFPSSGDSNFPQISYDTSADAGARASIRRTALWAASRMTCPWGRT